MSVPTPEQRKAGIAGVFDRAAETYDQVGVDFFGPVAQALVARTAPRPGEQVLDVGCGRGASALRAARAVGRDGEVRAIDLAPRMVEGLRQLATDVPWLHAEVGDAEQPPPGPWDVIQASLVLFFLPDLSSALDRYRAELSSRGRLGLSWFGAVDASWEQLYDLLVDSLPEDSRPPTNVAGQGPFGSVEALESLLRECGFRDVATTQTRVHTTFADPSQWWDWTWSQGHRTLLEQHRGHGTLDAVVAQVQPLLEARHREGRLSRWTDIRVTVARP
ncbi:class I SAM-dependent methyltransferase [Knoellia sp. CPCC 206435]|uniref:class I SAM-dependent methyltransferase n=1 Tax=Knoellia terrae TaxID=3404797 RepID=UPI003B431CF6